MLSLLLVTGAWAQTQSNPYVVDPCAVMVAAFPPSGGGAASAIEVQGNLILNDSYYGYENDNDKGVPVYALNSNGVPSTTASVSVFVIFNATSTSHAIELCGSGDLTYSDHFTAGSPGPSGPSRGLDTIFQLYAAAGPNDCTYTNQAILAANDDATDRHTESFGECGRRVTSTAMEDDDANHDSYVQATGLTPGQAYCVQVGESNGTANAIGDLDDDHGLIGTSCAKSSPGHCGFRLIVQGLCSGAVGQSGATGATGAQGAPGAPGAVGAPAPHELGTTVCSFGVSGFDPTQPTSVCLNGGACTIAPCSSQPPAIFRKRQAAPQRVRIEASVAYTRVANDASESSASSSSASDALESSSNRCGPQLQVFLGALNSKEEVVYSSSEALFADKGVLSGAVELELEDANAEYILHLTVSNTGCFVDTLSTDTPTLTLIML